MKELTKFYRQIPVMMDSSGAISPKPFRPGHQPKEIDLLPFLKQPGLLLKTNPRLRIRREAFGCVVQNPDAFTIKVYDHDVYELLVSLRDAKHIDEIRDFANPVVAGLLQDRTIINADHETLTRNQAAQFYDFGVDKGVVFQSPLSVDLEITRKCGRKCDYCAYSSSPTVDTSNELSTEQWFAILEDLNQAGVLVVEFTGGDIMTRSDATDIITHAEKLGLFYLLTSDLTALSERFLSVLPNLKGLIGLQTTIDGHTPEVHDHLRGHGAFNRLLSSVQVLQEIKIPILGGIIVNRDNAKHIADILEFCIQSGIDTVQTAALYPSGRGGELVESVPDNALLGIASRTFADYVFRGLVKPSVTNFYYFEDEFHSSPSTFNHMQNMVYMAQSGYDSVRVSPHGVCYPSIKFEGTQFESVGNITTTKIRQLWLNSPGLQSLRQLKTLMPESHFHAVDVRYLKEFMNSPYAKLGDYSARWSASVVEPKLVGAGNAV
jgi:MoaA/NifB/PqqE/SkfB family radical SAM enzyme